MWFLVATLFSFNSDLSATDLSESLRLNGFLTFGASTVDKEGVTYHAYPDQSGGTEKGEVDFGSNSLIGLQADYDLSDQLSLTVQGVSRKNEKGNFAPSLEWAYVAYHPQDELDIRLGLFHVPLFRNAELDYINYTRTWATTPYISQFSRSFSQFHGIDLLYYAHLDSYELTFQASYGADEPDLEDTRFIQEYKSDDIKVTSLELSKGMSRFKLAYLHANVSVKDVNTPLPDKIDEKILSINKQQTLQQTIALDFEVPLYGTIFSGGFSTSDSKKIFPPTKNHYLSLAYPYKKFTPYILHTEDMVEFNKDNTKIKERKYALGLRYDLLSNIALKAQIDSIRSSGMKQREGHDDSDNDYHAFTLLIDMVF